MQKNWKRRFNSDMSWITTLVKTYDNLTASDKFIEENKFPDVPVISHITAKSQIEITIDAEGCFREAKTVDEQDEQGEKDCEIIIPATEDSVSRASTFMPHPLCDTLSYLAGDYSIYAASEKEAKNADKKFELYIAQLKEWAESENAPVKVKAIYKYLEKKTVIADLVSNSVVELNTNKKFSSKKINGQTYEKSIVRFRVSSDDDSESACWKDKKLFHSYMEHSLSTKTGEQDKCYGSGVEALICVKHPKGIVASSYSAKLISANDEHNFTYRGRFLHWREACAVSYETTQKAHIALSWLVKTQGYSVGKKEKRTYVCWCPDAKKVENPVDCQWNSDNEGDNEAIYHSHEEYKEEIKKLFSGRKANFTESDTIVLISLDAATTGRLSITYYNELGAMDFFNRMQAWADSCQWYFKKKNSDGKFMDSVKTPNTIRIIYCAFGAERNDFLELDSKILKQQTQRILHCIADCQNVPYDIVHALFLKASNPQKYQKWYNYEETLSTACALTAKYYNSHNEEVKFGMELDKNKTDRSYLFGRLLAIAELIEARTYNSDTMRTTNASKLQPAFVNHPLHTWKLIEDKLNPYYKQSGPIKEAYYKKLISEIFILFETDDRDKLNMPLDEAYLIGYYLQRKEMNTKSKEDKSNGSSY